MSQEQRFVGGMVGNAGPAMQLSMGSFHGTINAGMRNDLSDSKDFYITYRAKCLRLNSAKRS